jgi:hypothetical protein
LDRYPSRWLTFSGSWQLPLANIDGDVELLDPIHDFRGLGINGTENRGKPVGFSWNGSGVNVAGPRESKRPGVYAAAARCLEVLLGAMS